jgi:hypothetical protein
MKKAKKVIRPEANELIKVQLDYRTIIYVKSMNALQSWLSRYPKAKVLE